jgi:hypothetical protein
MEIPLVFVEYVLEDIFILSTHVKILVKRLGFESLVIYFVFRGGKFEIFGVH